VTKTLTYDPMPEVIVPDKRLGRFLLHDEESKRYAIQPMADGALRTTDWERVIPILDQGHWFDATIQQWIGLGSCVPNSAVGIMGSEPFFTVLQEIFGDELPLLEEDLAVGLYEEVTRKDPFAGYWRPDDTGSNGLSMAKVMVEHGWASGYRHAMSLEAMLTGLQDNPGMMGVPWMSGMDNPTREGIVHATGYERGGHEIEVLNCDLERELLEIPNSWGTDFGRNGYIYIPFEDARILLANDGDYTSPVLPSLPAPKPTLVVPTGADAALVNAMDRWEKGIVSRLTTSGRAKAAYDDWKRAKQYSL
jgi:hypothetical protein